MIAPPLARPGLLALSLGLMISTASAAPAEMPEMPLDGDVEAGRIVANDRAKGNCVACHAMAGSVGPGAIGPVLIAMQTRFPSKEALARQIWDATATNPAAVMPPFGKHEILTHKEFVDVVEFIWSL